MSRTLKVSNLDQAEAHINRLREQQRIFEHQVNDAIAKAKEEVSRVFRSQMKSLQKELEEKQKAHAAQTHHLRTDMQAMHEAHRQGMQQQAESIYKDLSDLKDWAKFTMADVEGHMETLIEEQNVKLDTLDERVNRLYQAESDNEKKAVRMVSDLKSIFLETEKRLDPAKFCPDEWTRLRRRVERLRVDKDMPATVVMGDVLAAMHQLWDLEETIMKAPVRFEILHRMALASAIELLRGMSANRKEDYLVVEGEVINSVEPSLEAEIDYWTRGAYTRLRDHATALRDTLVEEKDSVDMKEEKVQEIAGQIAQAGLQYFELIGLSLQRALASNERARISEELVNALEEQGFQLIRNADGTDAHQYLGGEGEADQREGVFAILRNGIGMEVTLIVHPDETATENKLLFQRNDHSPASEEELRRRTDEIRRIIRSRGYEMAEAATPGSAGDNFFPELAEAAALKKAGLSRQLKTKFGFING